MHGYRSNQEETDSGHSREVSMKSMTRKRFGSFDIADNYRQLINLYSHLSIISLRIQYLFRIYRACFLVNVEKRKCGFHPDFENGSKAIETISNNSA